MTKNIDRFDNETTEATPFKLNFFQNDKGFLNMDTLVQKILNSKNRKQHDISVNCISIIREWILKAIDTKLWDCEIIAAVTSEPYSKYCYYHFFQVTDLVKYEIDINDHAFLDQEASHNATCFINYSGFTKNKLVNTLLNVEIDNNVCFDLKMTALGFPNLRIDYFVERALIPKEYRGENFPQMFATKETANDIT